jgi:hypothetical protein
LNFETVAEFDKSAGSFANNDLARRVEGVEIVGQGGEGDEATHGQVWDINEEAEVAQVGHECGIGLRATRGELSVEKGVELYVFAVAFGVCGVAFRGGNVIGGFWHRVFAFAFLKE